MATRDEQVQLAPTATGVAEEGRYRRRDRSLLCTIDEAADLLSIGRTSVYQLMNSGQLRSVKVGARRLVPRAELEAFVNELLETS